MVVEVFCEVNLAVLCGQPVQNELIFWSCGGPVGFFTPMTKGGSLSVLRGTARNLKSDGYIRAFMGARRLRAWFSSFERVASFHT